MQVKNRYFRRSHLSKAQFRRIVRYFAHDLPASKIAELSDISRPTINQLLLKLRIGMAQAYEASSPLSGEVETVKIGMITDEAIYSITSKITTTDNFNLASGPRFGVHYRDRTPVKLLP